MTDLNDAIDELRRARADIEASEKRHDPAEAQRAYQQALNACHPEVYRLLEVTLARLTNPILDWEVSDAENRWTEAREQAAQAESDSMQREAEVAWARFRELADGAVGFGRWTTDGSHFVRVEPGSRGWTAKTLIDDPSYRGDRPDHQISHPFADDIIRLEHVILQAEAKAKRR